jgi:quercetin dioxygenase-like cupin family protein
MKRPTSERVRRNERPLLPRAGDGGGARLTAALAIAPASLGPLASPAFAEAPLPNAFDAGWKGAAVCEKLFESEKMRAARCTFPPGVGHEKHWHGAHWGYVVSGGVMRITDAGGISDREVRSGDSWWSDGVDWHEVVNVGASTAVYVIVEPKGETP